MSSGSLVRLVLLLAIAGLVVALTLWSRGPSSPAAPTHAQPASARELEEEIRRSLTDSMEKAGQRTDEALEGSE